MNKHINFRFPFKDNIKGYYLDSNITTADSLKSDILHVMLTQKGDRFYNPDFGTNLYKYIFEPNDSITLSDIKNEANSSLNYCMPNIQINTLNVVPSEESDYAVTVIIIANDSEDIYINNIYIEVNL